MTSMPDVYSDPEGACILDLSTVMSARREVGPVVSRLVDNLREELDRDPLGSETSARTARALNEALTSPRAQQGREARGRIDAHLAAIPDEDSVGSAT